MKLADEETDEEQVFQIVGEDEADISQGLLSVTSPLARALIVVAKVGTVIPVEMYLAVAEVLAFVMRQRERFGASWRGTAAA